MKRRQRYHGRSEVAADPSNRTHRHSASTWPKSMKDTPQRPLSRFAHVANANVDDEFIRIAARGSLHAFARLARRGDERYHPLNANGRGSLG